MKTRQRGVSLAIVCLASTGLAIASLMAGDVGMELFTRSKMQAAADAAALAGARTLYLGTQAAATTDAITLAQENGYVITGTNVTFLSSTIVQVSFSEPQSLILGPLTGLNSVKLTVTAQAGGLFRQNGLRPFGIPQQNFVVGQTYQLKLGTTGITAGNFQPLDLGGSGAQTYSQNVEYGAWGAYNVGDYVPTETGNMVGPTRASVTWTQTMGDTTYYAPIVSSTMYYNSNGKSEELIVAFGKFLVTGTSGNIAVNATFQGYVSGESIPGTIVGSRLLQ